MSSVLERLQHGVSLHQSSQYDAARSIYSEVLSIEPENADAIHLMGVLDMQSGDNASALARLSRAAQLQPNAVNILSNLGSAQRRMGLFADALATYQRAIQIDPSHAECYHNMGVALRNQNRNKEAAECFRKAIELRPGYAEAIRNLMAIDFESGNWLQAMQSSAIAANNNPDDLAAHLRLAECQMRLKQFADAVKSFDQVLRINPDQITALNGQGLAYKGIGDLPSARKVLEKVLTLEPNNFPALANLGTVYQGQKEFDKAIDTYRKALAINENSAEVHNNIGGVLKEKGLMEEGMVHCKKAIELKPDLPSAHCNLAACHQMLGDLETAKLGYRRALELQNDLPEGLLGIASVHAQEGELHQAVACYSRSLFFDPTNAEARLYRGIIGLLAGDLANAWSDYEWRWQLPENNRRKFQVPRWNGGPSEGVTVLLHAEQGLGDTLQFIRYGKFIKEKKAKLIVECQKALLPLLSRLDWIDQLVAQGESLPAFSNHVPMMSMPGLVGTTLESIPADIPYLTADPELIEKWRTPIRDLKGFRVGIAWQGNPDFKQDKFRSIPLTQFAKLLGVEGTSFVSLQKGFGSEQLDLLPTKTREQIKTLEDVDTTEGAFMDTAAILQHLDLFITSDSAIAHLAGALGIRTWLVLPYAPDWRWLLKPNTTAWYPSMRLFRQAKFNSWDEVFAEMRDVLESTVGMQASAT